MRFRINVSFLFFMHSMNHLLKKSKLGITLFKTTTTFIHKEYNQTFKLLTKNKIFLLLSQTKQLFGHHNELLHNLMAL